MGIGVFSKILSILLFVISIYLFIENSFLSKEAIDLADELLRKGFIKSYKITKLYPYIDRYKFTDIVYLLRCHFRYNRFLD